MALVSPIASGSIDAALSNLINQSATSSGSPADEPRAVFRFGSKLRNFLKTESGVTDSISSQSLGTVEDTTNQMIGAMSSVSMIINPKHIEFDQPKRYARQDTQEGVVFHHFTNSKGQNNDILTIRFRGSTGNICRLTHRDASAQKAALDRLETWHNLYQLTREPMLLLPIGIANEFYIDYVSALFPVVIRFIGFYTQVLRFTEDASRPNSREYSMDFIVQRTSPDLNTLTSRILDFVNQQASIVDPSAVVLGS